MSRVVHFILLTLSIAVIAALGIALTRATWGVSSVWPANGLIIGLLYQGPKTQWRRIIVAVLAGSVFSNLWLGSGRISSLVFSLGNAIEVLVAGVALRWGAPASAVSNPRGLFQFLFFVVLLPAGTSASFVALLVHAILHWPLGSVAQTWLYSDALGLAIFLPLGSLARRVCRNVTEYSPKRGAYKTLLQRGAIGAAAHAAVLVAGLLIFTGTHRVAPYWALPPLVLGVLWAGSYAAVTGTFITAAVAVVCTVSQPLNGVFGAFLQPSQAIAAVQGFTLACMLTAYLVAAILSDRERFLRHATRSHRTQQKLADHLRAANDELNALAYRDSLTGVANRRKFDITLAETIQQISATDRALGLMFIDVDWFKSYNDCYGHSEGDNALRAVANALQTNLPERTTMARIGGEEFAVIWPDPKDGRLAAFARDAVNRVSTSKRPHKGSSYGHVTVSIGIVVSRVSPDMRPADLLVKADAAMYRAKQAGRNRYVLASN